VFLCPMVFMWPYTVTMGWKMQRVAVCDVCHHVWIPTVPHPTLCASKKCRSTLWDTGGLDRRTREARAKTGRRKARAQKKLKKP